MRQLAETTALRLQSVLSDELIANVGACLHPRQPLLVTGYYGTESRVDLWDIARGSRVQSLALHGKVDEAMTGILILGSDGMPNSPALPIRDLDLSPDGLVIAVASGKGVRLVNVDETSQSLRAVAELAGRQDAVHAVRFSNNGDLLASASSDGRLVIWSVATNQIVSEYRLAEAQFRCVDFSQDDLLVACGDSDGNIVVWDVVTGHQLAYFQAHTGEVNTLAFGPHGYLLATGGVDGQAKLWDMAESAPFGEPLVHGDSVYRVHFDSSGTMLFTCSFDQKVGVWRLDHQELIDVYHDDEPVLSFGMSRDDSKLVLVTSGALKVVANSRLPMIPPPTTNSHEFGSVEFEPALPALAPIADELEAVASMDGEMLVGEISQDYAAARAERSGVRPLAPPPEPLPYDHNPFDVPSGVRRSPFAPGESQVGPFGRADSTPLIPARQQSGLLKLKSDSARQRQASEMAEKRQSARYRKALVVSAVAAILMAAAALFINPFPKQENTELAAPAREEARTKLDEERRTHQAELTRLETRLEKLKRGTGDRNVGPLKAEIQRGIEAEKKRHAEAVAFIGRSEAAAIAKLEPESGPHPLFRALVSGVLTFALLIVLFWIGVRFLFRGEPEEQDPTAT